MSFLPALQASLDLAIVPPVMAGRSLELHLESKGPYIHARLEGNVDETLDLTRLLEAARGKRVVMVLRGVARLSSFGVREWTYTMRQLSHKAEQVYFAECSPAIVSQLNMVANFGGTAKILSVQAPYFCPKCDTDAQVTLNLTGMQDVELGEVQCPSCQSSMEFDEDPESYLSYAMKHQASERSNPGWDGFVLPISQPPSPAHSGSTGSNAAARTMSTSDVSDGSTQLGTQLGGGTGSLRSVASSTNLSTPMGGGSDYMSMVKASLVGLAVSTVVTLAIYFLWPGG